tara:strand:- start:2015 stop:3391 length:1377 start_codon:yes stop_codon:yes gene_type:complete
MSIPNELKSGSIPTNYITRLESDVIDPAVVNDNFIRIIVPSKGYLSSDSEVVFELNELTEAKYFPLGIGINSLVSRATLRCGGKTINEISDFGHYQSYMSSFLAGETVKQLEMVKTGRSVVLEPLFGHQSTIVAPADSVFPSHTDSVGYGLVNCNEYNASRLTAPSYTDLQNGPQFAIKLRDLFPLFRATNEIPTFKINDNNPLTIELQLADTADRLIKKDSSDAATTDVIKNTSIKLLADFTFYPQEVMESQRDNEFVRGYVDYQLAKQSLNQAGAKNQIRNVGGAGRIVTKIITMLTDEENVDEDSLQSIYVADSVVSALIEDDVSSSTGTFTMNVKYNGEFLYPIDIKNEALTYHLVTQTEGSPLYVNKEMYSGFVSDLIAKVTWEGQDQVTDLAATYFYQAHRLNDSKRINSRGIEIYYKYNEMAPQNFVHRTYLELLKTFTIDKDGFVNCYFN